MINSSCESKTIIEYDRLMIDYYKSQRRYSASTSSFCLDSKLIPNQHQLPEWRLADLRLGAPQTLKPQTPSSLQHWEDVGWSHLTWLQWPSKCCVSNASKSSNQNKIVSSNIIKYHLYPNRFGLRWLSSHTNSPRCWNSSPAVPSGNCPGARPSAPRAGARDPLDAARATGGTRCGPGGATESAMAVKMAGRCWKNGGKVYFSHHVCWQFWLWYFLGYKSVAEAKASWCAQDFHYSTILNLFAKLMDMRYGIASDANRASLVSQVNVGLMLPDSPFTLIPGDPMPSICPALEPRCRCHLLSFVNVCWEGRDLPVFPKEPDVSPNVAAVQASTIWSICRSHMNLTVVC